MEELKAVIEIEGVKGNSKIKGYEDKVLVYQISFKAKSGVDTNTAKTTGQGRMSHPIITIDGTSPGIGTLFKRTLESKQFETPIKFTQLTLSKNNALQKELVLEFNKASLLECSIGKGYGTTSVVLELFFVDANLTPYVDDTAQTSVPIKPLAMQAG